MAPDSRPAQHGKFKASPSASIAAAALMASNAMPAPAPSRRVLLLPHNVMPATPRTERDAARGSSDVRKQNRVRRKRRGW